jgi:hypothetical protein
MRTLTSLLATAALVGGATIASAQQSGSPTQPSGAMAGDSSPNATQGVRGTQRIETTGQATKKGAKKGAKTAPKPSPSQGSGSPNQPSGAGAGGAPAPR